MSVACPLDVEFAGLLDDSKQASIEVVVARVCIGWCGETPHVGAALMGSR